MAKKPRELRKVPYQELEYRKRIDLFKDTLLNTAIRAGQLIQDHLEGKQLSKPRQRSCEIALKYFPSFQGASGNINVRFTVPRPSDTPQETGEVVEGELVEDTAQIAGESE